MRFYKKLILFLILTLFCLPFLSLGAGDTLRVDLGVGGCDYDGICEPPEENSLTCPVDCAPPTPTPEKKTTSGSVIDIVVYNLKTDSDYYSAEISWDTNLSTISTLRWGQTTETKEGVLQDVNYARNHKMQILNLKPGTLYYFIVESKDTLGRYKIETPIFFFTKFLKDTAYPLNPLNVKTSADVRGITLTWQIPPDPNFDYIRITRHEDRFRSNPLLGKLIYEGKAEKFLDTEVVPGKKYFYALFSRNIDGKFSSGVAAEEVAYSEKILEQLTEKLFEIFISETFFVHQHNQLVEPLTEKNIISIESDKNTIVDTDKKTKTDDWLELFGPDKKLFGQFLFSFNQDSGRYQTVLPPLNKIGEYEIKIFRYRENIPTLISHGYLLVQLKDTFQENKIVNYSPFYDFGYYILLVILFILLFLLIVYLQHRQKKQEK